MMGGSILLSFWRVHKCRKEILRQLGPFTARSALLVSWPDAMALGFLITVITRLAEHVAGSLASDALGALQVELWGILTDLPTESVGERIVLLSVSRDSRFVEGRRRAEVFATALLTIAPTDADAGIEAPDAMLAQGERQAALATLWDRCLADDPAL